MSAMNANTTAPANVPANTSNGSGAMAIPRLASVEAINKSATDESINQKLGRVDHSRWRLRFV